MPSTRHGSTGSRVSQPHSRTPRDRAPAASPHAHTPPTTPKRHLVRAGLKGLGKSLLLSAAILGPGLLLFDEEPVIASFWLLIGSFGMMAWTYRRPWRMMWITCLLPPLGAGAAYIAQLVLLPGEPDLHFVALALAVGLGVGILRGRAHQVYAKDGAILAQRTVAYLALWVLCYGITQFFAFEKASGLVSAGRVGGAFSTAMLAAVSLVLLVRFTRVRRSLALQPASTRAATLASLAVLPTLLLGPATTSAQPIANGCTVTAYPDPASPTSRAVLIQLTEFNRPQVGDLYYFVYVIQNPDGATGQNAIRRLWPDEIPPVQATDAYGALLALAQDFCRRSAVRSSTTIVGAEPAAAPPVGAPEPSVTTPDAPAVPPGTPPGTTDTLADPWTPWEPPPRSGPSTEEVAEAAALVSIILIAVGIGVGVANSIAAAVAGAVQATVDSAADHIADAVDRAEGPPPRDGPSAASSDTAIEVPPAAEAAVTGVVGEAIDQAPRDALDAPSPAVESTSWIWDQLTDPNNWWGVGRSMRTSAKAWDELSDAVGRAGWDGTDLGWGINLISMAQSRAAREVADLPRQAAEAVVAVPGLAAGAASAIWDAASDPDNQQAAWDSLCDLAAFAAGHRATIDRVGASMQAGVETAGDLAGELSVAVEQDPEAAAIAVTRAVVGAENWEKTWQPDVPLLERLGRAIWGAIDSASLIWGVGTTAKGAITRASNFVRGADVAADVARGSRLAPAARIADKGTDAASAAHLVDKGTDAAGVARIADKSADAAGVARVADQGADTAGASRLGKTGGRRPPDSTNAAHITDRHIGGRAERPIDPRIAEARERQIAKVREQAAPPRERGSRMLPSEPPPADTSHHLGSGRQRWPDHDSPPPRRGRATPDRGWAGEVAPDDALPAARGQTPPARGASPPPPDAAPPPTRPASPADAAPVGTDHRIPGSRSDWSQRPPEILPQDGPGLPSPAAPRAPQAPAADWPPPRATFDEALAGVDAVPGGEARRLDLPDPGPSTRASRSMGEVGDAARARAARGAPQGPAAAQPPGSTPRPDGTYDLGDTMTTNTRTDVDDVLRELERGRRGPPAEVVREAPAARVVSQRRAEGCVPAAAAAATGADPGDLDRFARQWATERGVDPNIPGHQLEAFLKDAGLQPRAPTPRMQATVDEVRQIQNRASVALARNDIDEARRLLDQSGTLAQTLRPEADDLLKAVNERAIVAGLSDKPHFVSIQAGRHDATGRAWFQLVDPDPHLANQVQWVSYDDLVKRITWRHAWQLSPR